MRTNFLKTMMSVAIFAGMMSFMNAQQTKDCNQIDPKAQKACFEQLVAFSLSELIEYPESATFEETEGIVYVRFTTDENNDIQNIRVLGKANKDLADAVVTAVRKLDLQDSKKMMAANSVYRIPVNFELED